MSLLEGLGIRVDLVDERFDGMSIDVDYHGGLRADQHAAAWAMMGEDTGLLCAATAFVKTAVAAWVIAQRKVNTLILAHRRQLMEQWRERLAGFLDIPLK